MKLILPKEHGAWAMWIAPFLIGTLATKMIWYHSILFFAVFFAYISISPFIQGVKRPVERRQMWKISFQYLVIALLLGLPFLFYFPRLLLILVGILPFFLINLYYAKQKKERALFNDLSAIVALTSTVLVTYEVGEGNINRSALILWSLQILFFFGSALYVKTLYREKQNLAFRRLAYFYMIALPILSFYLSGPYLMIAFLFSTIRGIFTPKTRLIVPKTVGIIEIGNTLWFVIFLLLSYHQNPLFVS
ncbi:YwiC-like family protein [Tepidibacillus fermentans]|uniref:YwiC-like protein n=1 Tax=Tepidibacillus fermentans TaxID=1281767 RepID=A0A4R3KLE7_9BACI|nr:YwiC-like family protein [Tepidibacillus fermentans]TCS84567.1 YwiC-like protein [Tepidibacillus fermentans]